MCGGDPVFTWTHLSDGRYSPRVWRWSFFTIESWPIRLVFSTCVEVIPFRLVRGGQRACILHVCGGDPQPTYYFYLTFRYSPRVWRWSQSDEPEEPELDVFSTCVEVILSDRAIPFLLFSILHVCGGDPNLMRYCVCLCLYSPRVWRWSSYIWKDWRYWRVFSTCVEVILMDVSKKRPQPSILHVCGGDP